MRKIERHKRFEKNFQARVNPDPKLVKQFEKRLLLFIEGVSDYPIYDHALSGKLTGKRAFSVASDVRVVYKVVDDTCILLDIGSHNQVYK
ncbi:type II toxin-antitoxin system mRNA interferase toxin, RelE/StbE family [Candidatus Saccharibacteria bacterium CG10_big_fil_rev_8_21_14_0_10_47_8]|nr:MAG: type II toxin-antitoxin system mRNA interferase toxin, RelE/StbE family [Candidatus Saccharibacteria bacterium CG10_big_fil_rev_8_21_14_0_10_47_8]